MLEFDEDGAVDYVTPIMDLMKVGKYEEARAKLAEVPLEWRIAVLWTVGAQTGIVL